MPAEYEPTAEQRALVENAAAFGLTQADIAEQLGIVEKTLRKHFRDELSGGKFKVDMIAGKTVVELMKSRDERVRLEVAKYYTARRMGWKENALELYGLAPRRLTATLNSCQSGAR
jgi:predicted transcriptional regulator